MVEGLPKLALQVAVRCTWLYTAAACGRSDVPHWAVGDMKGSLMWNVIAKKPCDWWMLEVRWSTSSPFRFQEPSKSPLLLYMDIFVTRFLLSTA
jgi:hypothetical protein